MEGPDREYITTILKSNEEYKEALGLQMVHLIAQGKSSREVADINGVRVEKLVWVDILCSLNLGYGQK